MPWFWKAYTSEVTQLIHELREQRPTLEAEQQRGRGLLWDRAIDRDAQARYREARVPQKPYPYQTQPTR